MSQENKKEYWLISKNKDGTTWKVSASNSDSINMFCNGELLTVVMAYSKDDYTFDQVKKEKDKLMSSNQKLKIKNNNVTLFSKYYFIGSLIVIILFLLINNIR